MADGTLRRPANTLRCDWCAAHARPKRYSLTAAQVAERDGTDCKWCGHDVDLSLIGSRSKWAPSVDHIIPWALGGTNEPSNLQLMHRVCNAQKGTRTV
jgi:5-methylcytosine-specific restriction endonuclease McrA